MNKAQFSERMRQAARERMVQGNPPECDGDWFWMEPVVDSDGVTWRIDYRPDPTGGWFTIKVYADGRVQRKANFWFGWNGERTNRSRDLGVMYEKRPALYTAVMERLAVNTERMESKRI